MSNRSNYYKLIFEKFDKNDHKSQDESIKQIQSQLPERPEVQKPYEIHSSLQIPIKSSYQKRLLKFTQKMNFDSISGFIKTLAPLKLNTMIDYIQIINDFIEFSPQCDSEDYIKYLKHRTGLTGMESLDGFVVKGTYIKHANIIRRFLIYLNHEDVPKVKIEYYKIPKRVDANFYPKTTTKEVFNYYQTLSEKGKIEDAVLLHTMFALGLEPYNLSLLTFESIKNDKTLHYWDHKTRKTTEIKLTSSLYTELLYLKNWKRLNKTLIENEERESMDGVFVVGSFIFSTNPTGIYNKFNRKFGGILKDFDLTPRDLIVLSKYKERQEDKGFHR